MGKDVHNKMAKFAFDEVSKIGNKDREFRSLARSFPSMIQVNGLAGALAYLFSKKQKKNGEISAAGRMYGLLNDWFKTEECQISVGEKELMCQIVGLDSITYRLYVNEIMNLCLWIKRFAEAMIDGGE